MKQSLIKILLMVTALAFTNQASASGRWETLRAINLVENPTNQTQVGRFGELGPYQFRPATWRMHTDKPFRLAIQRDVADEVAVKHYEWIKRMLDQAGIEPNAFNIAMAWNCGLGAVVQGRVPSVTYNYAQRVSNLVEKYQERMTPPVVEEPKAGGPGRPGIFLDERGEVLRFRIQQQGPRFVLATS
jgi:hypothetical protein